MKDGAVGNSPKAAVRDAMRQRLRELDPEDRQSLSEQICERVCRCTAWQEATSVAVFSPLPSEPDISILRADAADRHIGVTIIPASARDESQLGLETAPDVILVPGLAFSKDRHRLGRGGGFFDRLLAGRAKPSFKIGVCFSFQLLDSIPQEPHDMLMDAVANELDLIA